LTKLVKYDNFSYRKSSKNLEKKGYAMAKDKTELILAQAERLADVSDYGMIVEREKARRTAELKKSVAPRLLELTHILLTGTDIGENDWFDALFYSRMTNKSKLFIVLEFVVSGGLLAVLVGLFFGLGAEMLCICYMLSVGLAVLQYYPEDLEEKKARARHGQAMQPIYSMQTIKALAFTILALAVIGFTSGSSPWLTLACLIPPLISLMVPNFIDHRRGNDFAIIRSRFRLAVQLVPGFVLFEMAVDIVIRAVTMARGTRLMPRRDYNSAMNKLAATPPGQLVREFAVGEIHRIETELLGSGSEIANVEKSLQERLATAEDLKMQLQARLLRSVGKQSALEHGVVVAQERVAELQQVLNRHREVMSKARAILHECRISAEGLSDAVADAELLRNLEEQAFEDQRQIALSELAMEQSVDKLRYRVMHLEGVLAQLDMKRVSDADEDRGERMAYLDRVEAVAESLATI
jgi:hypothetical protein